MGETREDGDEHVSRLTNAQENTSRLSDITHVKSVVDVSDSTGFTDIPFTNIAGDKVVISELLCYVSYYVYAMLYA